MPKLRLKRVADEQFTGLPAHVQDELEAALLRLQANPMDVGIPLVGRLAGQWRMRVGGYRIVYRIVEDGGLVIVDAIRTRGESY